MTNPPHIFYSVMSSLTGRNYMELPGEILLIMHLDLHFFQGECLKHARDSNFNLMSYIAMTGRQALFLYILRPSIRSIRFLGKQLLCLQSITSGIRGFSLPLKCPLPVSEGSFLTLK